MSSEKKASRPVSRRAVVGAAVWATPVVAVVAATPAHAVGSPGSPGSPTSLEAPATVNVYAPGVGTPHAGEIQLNTAQIWYDPNQWETSPSPSTATVSWKVYVVNASTNEVVHEFYSVTGANMAGWGNITKNNLLVRNLPAGDYKVISEISSVVYSPNPVNNVRFSTSPSSMSTNVTVW